LDGTGVSLVTCEDLNGDGVRDLIVGAPGAVVKDGRKHGAVRAISGKDLKVIWECVGPCVEGRFGLTIALTNSTGPKETRRILVGAPFAQVGELKEAGLIYELDLSGVILREIGGTK
jgi:hypothetical protein